MNNKYILMMRYQLFFLVFSVFILPAIVVKAQVQHKLFADSTIGIPKGTWFMGGTISWGTRNADNDAQLFNYYVNQKKTDVEIRLDAGYTFKKNVAAGLGLLYGRIRESNTTKSTDGIITDNEIAGSTVAFRPFVKNFIPLGKSERFFVIIPTELQIGFGSQLKEAVSEGVLTRTYTQSNFYGLAMRPGILAFIYKNFGFEVNVGAFGLSTRTDKTSVTGSPDGKVVTNDLNLKINVLNLSLGFSGYF